VTVVRTKDPLDADPKVTTVRLGRKLIAEIEAIARQSELSRNKVVSDLLKAGLQLHKAEQKAGDK
jgi:metal-responsive CopG/Arc/MetJ family transcriptional regulator